MNLPVNSFRQQILETVGNHSVVIVTAETGAGKSTRIPQFLLQAGYTSVCTQPRRLAASSVAERVADEMGENLGQTVGYRTAVDRQDSHETKALF
jgi:HrpA-like RNA helicase